LQKVYAVFSIDRNGEGQVGYDTVLKGDNLFFMKLYAFAFPPKFGTNLLLPLKPWIGIQ
jgi:hypothetical protein